MGVFQLGHMTWDEVRQLDKSTTVAVLPIGAVEAHGPHLPVNTDVVIASAMADAGAARLSARGYEVVVLPPLPYTAAEFGAGFPGTLSVSGETVTRVLVDVAGSLARHGVTVLAVANAHLDPAHLASLHAAGATIRANNVLDFIFPDLTHKPWATRLTEEFKSGACHAGRFESSIVQAARPDLVREAIRTTLSPNPASLSQAIRAGLSTFEQAGGPLAYFGAPAEATPEEGRNTIELLGRILEDAVVARGGGGGEESNQPT